MPLQPVALVAEPAALRAYHALEKMIVTLELPPAAITTEKALIENLQLGRTPVREAIQKLAWEGLIEIRPRAGLAIAPLKAQDWVQIVDARRGVETVLARCAARHAPPSALTQLQDAARAMHAAVVASDVSAFLEADKLLDEIIAEASDNIYAARVAAPLQTHSRRFWYRYHSESGLARSAAHHVALIRAIIDRDEIRAALEAEKLMVMLRELAEQTGRR
ncbi:GntR family transcriptional regulator [Aerobium aerolatum]|uniref:DNA-binding transcriptional regulator, GntR family n=1 Tax=Aquamicrobium aerolatum DSM 21857 TaxID=1121003 RepID=A0A1I3J3J8_9HYPH|nr:GntR family transcriptional regulator [Aquamicrobium aerolatum]SFI54750.1 DNA-binding transcriptional regulator, GntR family [Aquamicrobium aerolatum DSM 21857]